MVKKHKRKNIKAPMITRNPWESFGKKKSNPKRRDLGKQRCPTGRS